MGIANKFGWSSHRTTMSQYLRKFSFLGLSASDTIDTTNLSGQDRQHISVSSGSNLSKTRRRSSISSNNSPDFQDCQNPWRWCRIRPESIMNNLIRRKPPAPCHRPEVNNISPWRSRDTGNFQNRNRNDNIDWASGCKRVDWDISSILPSRIRRKCPPEWTATDSGPEIHAVIPQRRRNDN